MRSRTRKWNRGARLSRTQDSRPRHHKTGRRHSNSPYRYAVAGCRAETLARQAQGYIHAGRRPGASDAELTEALTAALKADVPSTRKERHTDF